MTHPPRHRGLMARARGAAHPDRVGFTHRRLEIIDLVSGVQPMIGRGGQLITYNGEIFNHVELRRSSGPEDDLGHRG